MRNATLLYESKYLSKLIVVIDEHLTSLSEEALKMADPDSFGLFESAEHIIGLGFVICQTYIMAHCGILGVSKKDAFELGPHHNSGIKVVSLINHAANYWKHNNEWPNKRFAGKEKEIADAFAAIGFPVDGEYPLIGMMNELSKSGDYSFKVILGMLETWGREVEDYSKNPDRPV